MKRTFYFIFFSVLAGCSGTKKEDTGKAFHSLLQEFQLKSGDRRSMGSNDMSAAEFSQDSARTRQSLAQLESIDTSQLEFDDRIDWRFAHSILSGQAIQQAAQPWKKDPRVYMAYTSLSALINGPGAASTKILQIKSRLEAVPVQLGNAMDQLEYFVPRFQELSIFMAENSFVLFDKELSEFIRSAGNEGEALEALSLKARATVEAYVGFLSVELPKKPVADFAIGKEKYEAMLKSQFLLPYNSDELWKFGWERFNETVAELEALAKEIDKTKTWMKLASEIKSDFPEHDEMIEAHQLWVDRARQHILENKLIPIPWKEKVTVVPRAEYLRKTSYYGNFSTAKRKNNDSTYASEWMINPFEEQWDARHKAEYLTEHDWGVIIVTAPHETYGGHHVQGLYQLHNPRPLRRNNGLSMFSEGWGLYNEHLMEETGFLPNERIHLRQLQLRLWRNARVIYDVGLHTGRMKYEDAISLMTDRVGFLRWAAQLEVDAAAQSPGYFIGYFMGMSEILRMREDFEKKAGDAFTLSDFHERLLKIGNMPPALMREALLRQDQLKKQ